MISGDIQKGVPIIEFLSPLVESKNAETPKSANFTFPLFITQFT